MMAVEDNKTGEIKRRHARHDERMRQHPEERERARGAFYSDMSRLLNESETLQAARQVKEAMKDAGDPLGSRLSSRAKEKRRRAKLKYTAAGKRPVQHVKVDDPYNRDATEIRPKYTDVTIGDQMHARKQIGDAQKRAFDRYLAICHRLVLGGGAIDPARIRVDHSQPGDPFPTVIDAGKEYRRLCILLGPLDSRIMYWVAGEGLKFEDVAARAQTFLDDLGDIRKATREQTREIGRRFRTSLTLLAEFWGYRGRTPGGDRRSHPFHSGPPVGVDEREWLDHFELVKDLPLDNRGG